MGRRSRTARRALYAVCALACLAAAAEADLLRCMGPDGKWIYTDNKALCPEAKPFEPKGEIQSTRPAPEQAPAAAPENSVKDRLRRAEARRRAAEAEEAEAQSWRDKKSQIEQTLERIQDRRTYLEKFVTLCNRGGLVFARDDAGIKRTVKCSSIKSQYANLEGEEAKARKDLERLPEECRRAGCLPGWLR